MMRRVHALILVCVLLLIGTLFIHPDTAESASAGELNRSAGNALKILYSQTPSAKVLGEKARAILVFPAITKGGFIVGGQYGEGALIKDGRIGAYYSTVSISYGLQAGIQKYGYALFFMTDSAFSYLDRSDGWELGTGPSIVIVDKGLAGSLSTTTAQSDVYAFFFDQKGLMAGLGLQGTKITRLNK